MKIETIKRCHLTTVEMSTVNSEGGRRTRREEEDVSAGEDAERLDALALLVGCARAQTMRRVHKTQAQRSRTVQSF